MKPRNIDIRAARDNDAEPIVALLNPYVDQELVLPRTSAEIRDHIANFLVAETAGELLGAVALRDFGEGLHEIRSLVVAPAHAGAGLGSRLVDAAVALARQRGAARIFALTMRPRLFVRLGFDIVGMEHFPEKVWSDCLNCPKRDRCDEVPVLMTPA